MRTVPDVIELVYGDETMAAQRLGVKRTAVCNWKAFGRFPARLASSILLHAKESTISLDVGDIPVSDQIKPGSEAA